MRLAASHNKYYFKVVEPTKVVLSIIGVLPHKERFFEDGVWHVATRHLLPIAKAGYETTHLRYDKLPGHLQLVIAQNKVSWKRSGVPKEIPLADDDPHEVLFLLPTAPPEVVKAVYKTLAAKYHPDRGGDSLAFDRLVKAYSKLKG